MANTLAPAFQGYPRAPFPSATDESGAIQSMLALSARPLAPKMVYDHSSDADYLIESPRVKRTKLAEESDTRIITQTWMASTMPASKPPTIPSQPTRHSSIMAMETLDESSLSASDLSKRSISPAVGSIAATSSPLSKTKYSFSSPKKSSHQLLSGSAFSTPTTGVHAREPQSFQTPPVVGTQIKTLVESNEPALLKVLSQCDMLRLMDYMRQIEKQAHRLKVMEVQQMGIGKFLNILGRPPGIASSSSTINGPPSASSAGLQHRNE